MINSPSSYCKGNTRNYSAELGINYPKQDTLYVDVVGDNGQLFPGHRTPAEGNVFVRYKINQYNEYITVAPHMNNAEIVGVGITAEDYGVILYKKNDNGRFYLVYVYRDYISEHFEIWADRADEMPVFDSYGLSTSEIGNMITVWANFADIGSRKLYAMLNTYYIYGGKIYLYEARYSDDLGYGPEKYEFVRLPLDSPLLFKNGSNGSNGNWIETEDGWLESTTPGDTLGINFYGKAKVYLDIRDEKGGLVLLDKLYDLQNTDVSVIELTNNSTGGLAYHELRNESYSSLDNTRIRVRVEAQYLGFAGQTIVPRTLDSAVEIIGDMSFKGDPYIANCVLAYEYTLQSQSSQIGGSSITLWQYKPYLSVYDDRFNVKLSTMALASGSTNHKDLYTYRLLKGRIGEHRRLVLTKEEKSNTNNAWYYLFESAEDLDTMKFTESTLGGNFCFNLTDNFVYSFSEDDEGLIMTRIAADLPNTTENMASFRISINPEYYEGRGGENAPDYLLKSMENIECLYTSRLTCNKAQVSIPYKISIF